MPPRLPTDRAPPWPRPLRLAISSGLRGTLADLGLRLACKGCGGAPVEAVLLDRADTLALPYGPAGWRLMVVETS